MSVSFKFSTLCMSARKESRNHYEFMKNNILRWMSLFFSYILCWLNFNFMYKQHIECNIIFSVVAIKRGWKMKIARKRCKSATCHVEKTLEYCKWRRFIVVALKWRYLDEFFMRLSLQLDAGMGREFSPSWGRILRRF